MTASVEPAESPPLQSAPGYHATSKRAFFGTVALSAGNCVRMLLQVVMLPIIARILGPAAYGLVALAMPVIVFANMLSDAGMGNALIRERNPSAEVESTIFWMTVSIGSVLALILCGGSTVLAALMHQPAVAPVLIAMSPILVLSSSLSVANARIARNRQFDLFAIGDFISAVLSSAVAIVAALRGFGAWSLVIQQLVLWIIKAAWILAAARYRPRLVWRLSLARPFLHFGLNSVATDLANFVAKSAPALIIGSELGLVAVGHYSMAYQLVRIPEWILSQPLYLATFTAVAALADQPATVGQVSLRAVRMVTAVAAPLFVGLALVADLLMNIFLGPKWLAAAPVLSILAFAGLFLCLQSVIGAVLMGLGRPDLQLRLSLVCGAGIIGGVAVGCSFGLDPAVLGLAVGAAVALPLYLGALAKQLASGARPMMTAVASPLFATGVMAAAVLLVRAQLQTTAPPLQLTGSILAGVLAYFAVLAITSGRQVLEDLKQILPAGRGIRQQAT